MSAFYNLYFYCLLFFQFPSFCIFSGPHASTYQSQLEKGEESHRLFHDASARAVPQAIKVTCAAGELLTGPISFTWEQKLDKFNKYAEVHRYIQYYLNSQWVAGEVITFSPQWVFSLVSIFGINFQKKFWWERERDCINTISSPKAQFGE